MTPSLPYRTTINGQKITVIAATQVIDSDLQSKLDRNRGPSRAGLGLRRRHPGLGG